MINLRPTLVSLCLLVSFPQYAQEAYFEPPERGFTSWLPASNWEHALLSGNGTMGAMVFGHPHEETIILSHGELFLPQKRSAEIIDQAAHLEEMRKLIVTGEYEEAAKIPARLREETGYSDQRDPFIPAFDIEILQEASNISRYVRSTNFSTAEAKTSWKDDLGTWQRRLFVSRADSLVVMSIRGSQPISCQLRFATRPVEWTQRGFIEEHIKNMQPHIDNEEWLSYKAVFTHQYHDGISGYEGVGKVIAVNGTTKATKGFIQISNADEVLVLIKISPTTTANSGVKQALRKAIEAAPASYDQLFLRHTVIHGDLYNRVQFNLNSNENNQKLHSEEILLKARNGYVSPALIEKVFDAGRYNLLCATGTNPPTLQGIWSGTWTAPWASGFTHDGNLPAAMASVMSGNMPELMEAYVNYLERYLPHFEKNAERLFGSRGINLPAHTTTTGFPTDFGEVWCLSLWTGGAGWAADILYDYYEYTGDTIFLRQHAYPWMKKAAWFYEDFIQIVDGKALFNPSYSPENNPSNSPSQAAINATMDVMIARQLLTNVIAAGHILGEEKSQMKIWQSLLKKLPPYKVNGDGVLTEWLWPGLEDNYTHRHVSQLYSLFNDRDPMIAANPMLQKGAVKLIDKKLEYRRRNGSGDMAFGLVQIGLSAAHLGLPDQSLEAVRLLAGQYWSTGLGSFHNVRSLFNTDISGGLPAVIIDMLAYAERDTIHLLAARPEVWRKGSLKGILLKKQIEVQTLSWNNDQVVVTLMSPLEQHVNIRLPQAPVKLSANITVTQNDTMLSCKLPKDEPVTFTFTLKTN